MELLERHFDTAFDAPDGIKKLRELILTLAMQGKLVPQDLNDQPASELLKEIEAEKKRLVKQGKIKVPKPLPLVSTEEIPYELPKGWEWVRLGAIGIVNPRNDIDNDSTIAGFIPMALIEDGYSGRHTFEKRKWEEIKKGFTHIANGDIGMAKITPCFENAKSCVFKELPNGIGAGTTELHVFRNSFDSLVLDFLLYYLKNPAFISVAARKMTGSAGQKRVSTVFFSENPFPLPPLKEQARIVAKIDELMELCDALEKLRAERDAKRLATHSAAVRQLLNIADTDGHTQACEFLGQHFGELYTVKENITQLRKAILQLAVMGRLVPQAPKELPASELLKQIAAEKTRLVKAGKIRAPKPLTPIDIDEIPFVLPNGWDWAHISDLAESIDYGTSQKTCDEPSLVRVYRMGNIVNGKLVDEGFKYIRPEIDELPHLFLRSGDILFNRTNSFELVGKSAPYLGPDNHSTFASYLIRIRLVSKHVNPIYVSLAMNAPYFRETQIVPEIVQQCGQANFNGTKLSMCAIPLPPLPEQSRIISRIDQLMSMCDALEQQIGTARESKSALLNAMMAQYGGQRCA